MADAAGAPWASVDTHRPEAYNRPAMTDDPSRPIAVVLTEEEVEFVKDALWYASRAEQVALADDPLFRDSFLAELKSTSLKREADGKPGFQDLFLVMQGVPAEELPPAAQQRLGVIGSDYQPPAETLIAAGISMVAWVAVLMFLGCQVARHKRMGGGNPETAVDI